MSLLLHHSKEDLWNTNQTFYYWEGEISSTEGTTQGDLLAMAMYALAVTPLIRSLRHHQLNVSQVWFADDATAAGQLTPLLNWWKYLPQKVLPKGIHLLWLCMPLLSLC